MVGLLFMWFYSGRQKRTGEREGGARRSRAGARVGFAPNRTPPLESAVSRECRFASNLSSRTEFLFSASGVL